MLIDHADAMRHAALRHYAYGPAALHTPLLFSRLSMLLMMPAADDADYAILRDVYRSMPRF